MLILLSWSIGIAPDSTSARMISSNGSSEVLVTEDILASVKKWLQLDWLRRNG